MPKAKTIVKMATNRNYFPRTIDKYLLDWKNSSKHKPLLLRGARQVGKSSAIRNLAQSFKYYIEINFEKQSSLKDLFKNDLEPHEISNRLSALYGVPIVPKETLLFLDEIQA